MSPAIATPINTFLIIKLMEEKVEQLKQLLA